MPIGATIGAAAITTGGAIYSSGQQKKAASKAADAQKDSSQAQIQLTRDIYNQNAARLDPWAQDGRVAGNAMMSLLGLRNTPAGGSVLSPPTSPPVSPAPTGPAPSALNPAPGNQAGSYSEQQGGYWTHPDGERASLLDQALLGGMRRQGVNTGNAVWNATAPQTSQWAGYLQANPDVAAEWRNNAFDDGTFANEQDFAQWHYNQYGQAEGRQLPSVLQPAAQQGTQQSGPAVPVSPAAPAGTPAAPTGTVTATTTASPAEQAFDAFRNSTNYQFRLNQGFNALNTGWAARGMQESGAAGIAFTEYGQNFAANELGNYMDRLAQQQQVGLGAVTSLAGNAVQMGQSVNAANQASADARANAALIGGQANANLGSSIASGLGSVAGAVFAPRTPTPAPSGGMSYMPATPDFSQYGQGNYGVNLGGSW
jgi:hypothetical protein